MKVSTKRRGIKRAPSAHKRSKLVRASRLVKRAQGNPCTRVQPSCNPAKRPQIFDQDRCFKKMSHKHVEAQKKL